MQKTMLFQTPRIEIRCSQWGDTEGSLPRGWQSLDQPRISFPETPLHFGSRRHGTLIVPGDMVVLDAEREHGVSQLGTESGRSVWIGVDPQIFDELGGHRISSQPEETHADVGIHTLPTDHHAALAARMIAEGLRTESIDAIDAEEMLYALIRRSLRFRSSPAARRIDRTAVSHREAVRHAVGLLEAETPPQSLAEIGEAVHLSPHYFCRVFKYQTGLTVRQYRQRSRLIRSVRCILSGEGTLSQIAACCGFSDQPHMTRTYTGVFGMTPGELAHKRSNPSELRTFIQETLAAAW